MESFDRRRGWHWSEPEREFQTPMVEAARQQLRQSDERLKHSSTRYSAINRTSFGKGR